MTKTTKTDSKKMPKPDQPSEKSKEQVQPQFLFGYKNSKGEIAIPARYATAGVFADGLAPVEQNGQWGVIDSKGQWVSEPKFELISKVENGMVVLRKGRQYGLAKISGDELLPAKYDAIVSVGKKAAVVKSGANFSILSLDGKTLVDDLKFASKWNVDGNVVAATDDGVGLLNEEGQWVVKPSYDAIYDYSEGLAAFEKEGRSGYLDAAGKVAIEPEFEAAYDFSEGLARVRKDGKFGYINQKGQLVIHCVWGEPWKGNAEDTDKATRFISGFAEVADADQPYKIGFIDAKGKWVDDAPKVPERKSKARELEAFRDTNPEWEDAQEAVVLGANFDKKLAAFEAKLEKAMENDHPSVLKAFQKIMKDSEGKKVRYLDLMVEDVEGFLLTVYENGEGEPAEFHPFKAIAQVFEGGVMPEPTVRKAVERLKQFDSECMEKFFDWCVEVWKEAGGAKFKIAAYIRSDDAIPYVDLKTGKRVEEVK